jgi:hypothetical protein
MYVLDAPRACTCIFPGEKESVRTQFIRVFAVLPYGTAPNRLFPVRSKKVEKGAL